MSWPIKQHDLLPVYRSQLRIAGAGVDLTGYTVRFLMTNHVTGVIKVNASATVMSEEDLTTAGVDTSKTGVLGWVEYAWEEGDTGTAALYRAEWEVTGEGKPTTFPPRGYLFIEISRDLDADESDDEDDSGSTSCDEPGTTHRVRHWWEDADCTEAPGCPLAKVGSFRFHGSTVDDSANQVLATLLVGTHFPVPAAGYENIFAVDVLVAGGGLGQRLSCKLSKNVYVTAAGALSTSGDTVAALNPSTGTSTFNFLAVDATPDELRIRMTPEHDLLLDGGVFVQVAMVRATEES